MTKTELKQNITKINKLLRSDSYEAGIELIITLDDPEIKKGTAKGVAARIKKILKQQYAVMAAPVGAPCREKS